MTAHVEISGKRIAVTWGFMGKEEFQAHVRAVKAIPGRSFRKASKDWTVPLDMPTCRALRAEFGELGLVIGQRLRSWAFEAKRKEQALGNLSETSSARLQELPNLLPDLYRALYLGPLYKMAKQEHGITDAELDYAASLFSAVTGVDYWDGTHGSYQTADVAFMASSPAPGNFNHQGLGKTPVTIGAVWEAGVAQGDHLVITPTAAVESVWGEELRHWQSGAPCSVEVFTCTGTKAKREQAIEAFRASTAEVRWLVVNPAMIMWEKALIRIPTWFGTWVTFSDHRAPHAMEATPKNRPPKGSCRCPRLKGAHWHYRPSFPFLEEHEWTTITNDEAHQGGNVRNHRSLSAKSINKLKSQRRHALTGTPMNAFGSDIWGILHFLRPDVFTGFWKFADRYFDVDKDGYGWTVGGLLKEKEQEFFQLLTTYALRRTKTECAPWLPEKQHIDVWVQLEGKQRKVYEEMEANGFAALDGERVSATSILAELTRLSQFARTLCTVSKGDVKPKLEGAKIDALLQKLDEAGVLDGSTDEQHLIFSESRQVIDLLADHLGKLKPLAGKVARITGTTRDRAGAVKAFQAGRTRVMCIVTTAGGVALTLDKADTCHFLDESWVPNIDEQAEDRAHRASRIHQVTIYHYRARATVDEDRMQVSALKDDSQKYILDVRRAMMRRIQARKEV